jgi:hypothetical protein
MPYCQHCRAKIDEDEVFCPVCHRSLVGQDTGWQDFKLHESIARVQRRADVYTALAAVLITLGAVGGSILCMLSDPIGLFGIPLVCWGIGFATAARRNDLKVERLRQWLARQTSA